ncbi:hypothetical protein PSYPI_46674, partial [Pseudomonas syringae pv. pisi str. 1704B]
VFRSVVMLQHAFTDVFRAGFEGGALSVGLGVLMGFICLLVLIEN